MIGFLLDNEQKQRIIVAAFTIIIVMCWPPGGAQPNLLFRFVHYAVDPNGELPAFPPPLPPGLGDNGDAVAAHDAVEAEYYRLYNSDDLTRWRMDMKASKDPFEPALERQFLVGLAALGAFFAWMYGKPTSSK